MLSSFVIVFLLRSTDGGISHGTMILVQKGSLCGVLSKREVIRIVLQEHFSGGKGS